MMLERTWKKKTNHISAYGVGVQAVFMTCFINFFIILLKNEFLDILEIMTQWIKKK